MGVPLKSLPPHVQRAVAEAEARKGVTRTTNKMNAVATMYNGVRYASKAEAAYAAKLDQLQDAGEVLCWLGQPKFHLGVPENVYRPDFLVYSRDKSLVAIEVKGHETAAYKRNVRLWKNYGEIPLWIVKRGKVDEIIEPQRKDV
jgi:hypothetical protein